MTKRKESKLQTRDKIADATSELLKEKSVEEINIEDITEKAGIAKGSFYTHFKRKEDVVSYIAAIKYDSIEKLINDYLDNHTLIEKISIYLTECGEAVKDNTLEVAQNYLKSISAPLENEDKGKKKYQKDYDYIYKLLKEAIESKELKKDTPIEKITSLITNYYYGSLASWCITSGEKDLEESIKEFLAYDLKNLINEYLEEVK